MGFNLKGIFQGKVKDVLDSAFKGLDNIVTSKEELAKIRLQSEAELNRHAEVLEAAALKEMELQNANTASARQRETDYIKATGQADKMQMFVGILIMLSFFAGLVIIGFKAIPEGNEHIMINALGILEGLVLSVAGYYYGSSLGSRIKDQKPK